MDDIEKLLLERYVRAELSGSHYDRLKKAKRQEPNPIGRHAPYKWVKRKA